MISNHFKEAESLSSTLVELVCTHLSDKELSARLASAAALKHLIFAHAGTMSAEAYVQVVLACVQCCASEKTSKGQQGLLGLVDTALSKCPLVDPGTGAMFNEALAFPELASSLESFTRYLLVLLKELDVDGSGLIDKEEMQTVLDNNDALSTLCACMQSVAATGTCIPW